MKKSLKVLMVGMFLVYSLALAACDFNALLGKLPFDIPFLEQKEEYTITFYVDDEVYFEIDLEEGKNITIPSEPYKDGYEFKGWYTASGNEVYEGLVVEGNLSLYASFVEINQSEEWIYVYFYVDDNLHEEQKIPKGTNIKSYYVPFKDGYEFDYWMYKDGNRFYNLDKLYEDTYLYAIFKQVDNKEERVIVNFYVDGKLEKTQDFIKDKYFENIFTPYKEGHTFSHWEDKYGNKYDVNTILKSNVDLYAVFNKIDDSVTCEVTYFVDALIYEKQVYSKNQTLKLPIEPYKYGYKFVGWYAGSMQYCEGDKVSGSVSLYARFEEVDDVDYITVTYFVDGKVDKTQQIVLSSSISDRYIPYKEGYNFKYWADIYGKEVNLNEKFYSDVYLYAVFEKNGTQDYNGFTYNEYSNYIEITGFSCVDFNMEVPESINGKPVTHIADYAFKYFNGSSFKIPNSVVYIGKNIFEGAFMNELVIPFIGPSREASYAYPLAYLFDETQTNNATVLPSCLFNVTVSDSNLINTGSFDGAKYIKNVYLGEGVEVIGTGSFSNSNIQNIFVSKKLKRIVSYAFYQSGSISLYYDGNDTEWNSVECEQFDLNNIKLYLYSETEPTTSGNYWHYLDGEVVIWGKVDNIVINYYVDGNLFLSQSVIKGSTFNDDVDQPEKKGYYTQGWLDSKGNKWYMGYTLNESIDLYLDYQPISYVINYNSSYNSDGMTNPNKIFTYTIEDEVIILDGYKEGYEFLGWYTDGMYHNKLEKIEKGTTGDIDLYPYLTEELYKDLYIINTWFDEEFTEEKKLENHKNGCYTITIHLDNKYEFIISSKDSKIQYTEIHLGVSEGVEKWMPNIRTTVSGTFKIEVKDTLVNVYLLEEDLREDYGFTYVEYPNHIEITSYKKYTTLIIPDRINNKPVISIADSAFYKCNIEKITLPNELYEIGRYAFYLCENLTIDYIPASVCKIGSEAFSGTTLNNVVIKDIEIAQNAFSNTKGNIYFEGDEFSWLNKMMNFNYERVYFYSETQPTQKGNFWHYVDGKPVVWEEYKELEELYIVKGLYGSVDESLKLTIDENGKQSITLHLEQGYQFLISNKDFSHHYYEGDLNIKEGVDGFAPNIRTTTSGTFKIEVDNDKVNVYLVKSDFEPAITLNIPQYETTIDRNLSLNDNVTIYRNIEIVNQGPRYYGDKYLGDYQVKLDDARGFDGSLMTSTNSISISCKKYSKITVYVSSYMPSRLVLEKDSTKILPINLSNGYMILEDFDELPTTNLIMKYEFYVEKGTYYLSSTMGDTYIYGIDIEYENVPYYTVLFQGQAPEYIREGETTFPPMGNPTMSGYVFVGWECEGELWTPGDPIMKDMYLTPKFDIVS